ncbi:MAG: Prolipoprotein diacylglyceryl transferase [Candidatus Collierbacteria bacterium GW2011_GWC1_45_47]|uniref:Phosphatidylglycerol--prolipoprotein diacylglyceryl transferase n=3 Tax=Candidatus Collieribacteriota TaxID=1752725 RepID=A0A0G1KDQ7_9BACT|nr:MAG: Prolipoprotein diacylglyceryl transferase [Candidatus Collierbacteria bacterium GW2011_GWF1_44_12]KKT45969.1 MAG: Prolipoprotein diacylglyceryl transferase [Candidatus Collierbacteria bacterium GW2011_GWF2_44_15]KKU09043.1 MAG: Prolipoprotein diacylglyceryl transferase [Candidatus Collierbacteria bacterium GW2011_GWC1_45_47]KKU28831.1 MAG: Prolipoprotein diacylglyceryl transferase [Candidatus Collierbacteria bacterium GW2011_GWE1_46_18]
MINILGINFHLYGLILGAAIILALEISSRVARKKNIDPKIVERFFIWTVVFGIIGARLYHVVDFWEKYYSLYPIRVLYLWEGGLAIWGAVTGGILGLWIAWSLSKIKNKFLELTDIGVSGLPLAQAVGRLGNWVNGELYGKNGEPLFAYEGILNVILFWILWKIGHKKKPGLLTGVYLMGYGSIRMFLENLREESAIWRIGGLPTAVIISGMAILLGVYLILRKRS